MAIYHPPKMITNNAAPVLSADLAYEAHGKCGCQTIFLTEEEGGTTEWEANNPSGQPELEGCTDYSNAYKIVALENTKFREITANNIAEGQLANFIFGNTGFKLMTGSEILADFTKIDIISGMLMIYRDCEQS